MHRLVLIASLSLGTQVWGTTSLERSAGISQESQQDNIVGELGGTTSCGGQHLCLARNLSRKAGSDGLVRSKSVAPELDPLCLGRSL